MLEHNHQGLDNKLIAPMNDNAAMSGSVVRRHRLGGVLDLLSRGSVSIDPVRGTGRGAYRRWTGASYATALSTTTAHSPAESWSNHRV
jgi:hypothetical protein